MQEAKKVMRRSSVLYKEKRIPTVERKNDMEKQEQEERKHIEALDSERSLDEIIDLIRNADEWI